MSATAKVTPSSPTLLVVDDDPQLRFATVRILEQAGYTVREGATAAEALALTRAHRPALVLLDVMLPDGDGREVARQLKTDPALAGVFIILVSGLKVSPADQAKGLSEGLADGYILRPVLAPVLLGWIEVFLRLQATQEKLRESEKLFRTLTEVAPVGIFRTDPAGDCLYVNRRWSEIVGLGLAEARGRGWLSRLYFEDRERVTAAWYQAAQEQRPFKLEYRFQAPDGSLTWVLGQSAAEIGPTGQIIGYIGAITDITERKQAAMLQETVYRIAEAAQSAESLQELYPQIHRHIAGVMSAENFYIALYDEPRDLITFVYWVDQRESFTSKPVRPGTGPTAHVLRTGQSLLFSTKELELGLNRDIELMGEPSEVWLGVPLRVHGKTMGVMAVQHYTNPQAYTEQDQRILEFVSAQVAAAIHRKQAEESLRLLEKRNHALIENAPDGIMLLDAAGRFTFGSPSVYRLFNYPPPEIVGASLMQKVHPDDLPAVTAVIRKAKRFPSERFTLEYRFRHQDGGYRWLESVFTNLLPDPAVNAIVVNFHDITGRKLAETELAQSRQKLEATLNALPDLLFELDDAHRIVDFRALTPELLYVPPEYFVGKMIEEILPPSATAVIAQALTEAERTGRHAGATYALPMPAGEEWFELSISTKAEPGKTRPHFIVLSRDITSRKQVEQALRESETKLKKAQGFARMGSWTWNIKTNQLDWSDQMYHIFGVERGTFTGSLEAVIAQAIHPADRAAVEQANMAVINEGNPTLLEYRVVWNDGTVHIVWAEAGELIRDEAGNPSLLSGTVQDITERKQAEETLRLQSAALNAAANAMVITDRAGFIQWVNPAFCDLTGYPAAEATGKNPRDVVKSGQHDQTFYQEMWDTLLSGQVWRGEIINRRKDGSLYPEELTITPVRDEPGEISHFIAIKQDITARKALEAENQKLTEQFYQAQKMESVGQLAGGIAHDFNNLLVPIVGYAELGLMAAPPASNLYSHFEQVKEAGDRAAGLTRQILAFSRRQVLEMKLVDLNQVVLEFEKMLGRLIGEHISLKTHLADNLPAIKADPGQLEQVLLNLVVNARDAMPNGGRLTIETAGVILDEAYTTRHPGVLPGEYVQLAVSDTGHGIDNATQQRIFEPFFTTKERGHGTGLGLSTVFGIVKQHGGNIWVYSELGQGTTFKVYLPVADRLVVTAATEPPTDERLVGNETILVVEDEAAVRDLVSRTLESFGYRVLSAGNSHDALALAAAHNGPLQLLLTDVIMPGLNGRELYQRLVAARPGLKVLYMSGYTDDAIAHHGVMEEGMAFLQKPFAIRRLLEKVRAALG